MPALTSSTSPFGAALRRHRTTRAWSQERLAEEAEISTRHLSFLENGKAAPSRTMVLVLGSALELTLRERNALLQGAGFAAAYREEPLAAPEAASLRQAVDLILERMEPYGAIAVDRAWNVLAMNGGASRLLAAFVDLAAAPPEVLANAMVATFHPAGLRPAIVDFDAVAGLLLDRARREALRHPDDTAMAAVRAAIDAIPGLPAARAGAREADAGPFLTVHLRRGDLEARVFTTIATIGTPIDATAEEIRIETYFPADEATRGLMVRLAEGG